MHKALSAPFQEIEQQRREYCSWVGNAPAHKRDQSPGPGQWSAGQVLYHLAEVETQVVHTLQKRLANPKPLRPHQFGTWLRGILLRLALALPIKFKTPKVLKEVPAQVEADQAIKNWQLARVQLQQLLNSIPAEQVDKELFFHPRAGMLTLPQTLRFLREHTQHHRRQLNRLLS